MFHRKNEKRKKSRSDLFLGHLEDNARLAREASAERPTEMTPGPPAPRDAAPAPRPVRRRAVRDLARIDHRAAAPAADKTAAVSPAEAEKPAEAEAPEKPAEGASFFPGEIRPRPAEAVKSEEEGAAPEAAEDEEAEAARNAARLFEEEIPGDAVVAGEDAPPQPFGATAFVKAFEEQSAA
ncbi:MAG: hypothetical protein II776_01035, partial [Clostridia bacterium]|nr:hypothetical protein [Clostridia bacterium]